MKNLVFLFFLLIFLSTFCQSIKRDTIIDNLKVSFRVNGKENKIIVKNKSKLEYLLGKDVSKNKGSNFEGNFMDLYSIGEYSYLELGPTTVISLKPNKCKTYKIESTSQDSVYTVVLLFTETPKNFIGKDISKIAVHHGVYYNKGKKVEFVVRKDKVIISVESLF